MPPDTATAALEPAATAAANAASASPTTTSATATTAPTAAEATPANAPEWTKEWGLTPEINEAIGKKGLKTPADLAASWLAAQRLVGKDPASIVEKPKEGDSAARRAYLANLGVPAKPEDYKLPVPEGVDPTFANAAAKWFHEEGIPQAEAVKLAERWNGFMADALTKSAEERAAAWGKDKEVLTKEWGEHYGARLEAKNRAMAEYGVTEEQFSAIAALPEFGLAGAARFFSKLGEPFMQHKFQAESGRSSGFGMTADEAKGELNRLKMDREFQKRFLNGDADARRKVDELNRIIVPT